MLLSVNKSFEPFILVYLQYMSEENESKDLSKELQEIRNKKMAYLNKRRDEINKEIAETQRKIQSILHSKGAVLNSGNRKTYQ